MPSPFMLRLDAIQPSQLFISADKLARVRAAFNFAAAADLAPLPVHRLDGTVIFTDGHTRALAAFLAGWEEIPAAWDEDALDWDAYRICVAWCREAGIRSIAHLQGRVIPAAEYELLWHDRCRAMQQGLEAEGSA